MRRMFPALECPLYHRYLTKMREYNGQGKTARSAIRLLLAEREGLSSMFETLQTARQIKQLTERVETVERQLQGLKIEWADVLDRMVTMNKRIVRAQRMAEQRGDTADTGLHLSDEEIAGGATSLTERARQANAAILARRNRSPQ